MEQPSSSSSPVQQFYENQTVFITGGTGFLGKLLIEKLLRSTNCKCIHLLIREKKGRSIKDRLNQLFDNALFDRLKNERPHFKNRIHLINGDCMLDNLGLQSADELVLTKTVNIVFHVAATVRFNEDLKFAYLINVGATGDVIRLCKKMDHLKSVVHVSTAYSHCYREKIDECFYDLPMDTKEICHMMETLNDNEIKALTDRIIGKWPNTYTFTKALAEDLIKKEAAHQQHLPIGIFRPSIVISTYKEPIPGWSDNLYGPNGVTASALMGLLRTFLIDDNAITDIIPADYCIAELMTVAWDVATINGGPDQAAPPPIYNCVSSPDNPITWREFTCLGYTYGFKYPSEKILWRPIYESTMNSNLHRFLDVTLHIIPGILLDFVFILCLQKPRILKTYQTIRQMSTALSYFTLNRWTFTNNNTKRLLEKLGAKDRELFEFNVVHLSWLVYFRSYIKGVRVYLLNDPLETLGYARRKLWWLSKAHLFFKFLLNMFIFFIIYCIFTKIFY